ALFGREERGVGRDPHFGELGPLRREVVAIGRLRERQRLLLKDGGRAGGQSQGGGKNDQTHEPSPAPAAAPAKAFSSPSRFPPRASRSSLTRHISRPQPARRGHETMQQITILTTRPDAADFEPFTRGDVTFTFARLEPAAPRGLLEGRSWAFLGLIIPELSRRALR